MTYNQVRQIDDHPLVSFGQLQLLPRDVATHNITKVPLTYLLTELLCRVGSMLAYCVRC